MKNKKTIFLVCSLLLINFLGFAQSPQNVFTGTSLPGSQGWRELKFDSSMPWEQAAKDLLVAPSEISAAVGTALKLKVNEQPGLFSQYGFYKSNVGFSPATGFTVIFKAKVVNTAPGAFNIAGVGGGKGFRLELSNSMLTERANPLDTVRTLSTADATDGFHTYRVVVAPDEKVRVWRDDVLLATLPLQSFKADNILDDGGFEKGTLTPEHGWNWMDEGRPGTLTVSNDPKYVRTGKYGLFVDKGTFKNDFIPVKAGSLYDVNFWAKKITYEDADGSWRDINGWYDPIGDRAMYGVVDKNNPDWKYYERNGVEGGGGYQRFILETPTGEANTNQIALDNVYYGERINPSRIPLGAVNLFPNGDFEDPNYHYFAEGDPRNDTVIVNPDNYRQFLVYYPSWTDQQKNDAQYDWDETPFWNPFWGARVRVQAGRQGNGESGGHWARSGKYSLRYFNCFSNTTPYGTDFSAARSQGRNTPLNAKVELEVGKTYTFSFWYHFAQWGGDHLKLHVNNGSQQLWYKDVRNDDFPEWRNVIVTFTTDATNHTLNFFTENTNEKSGYDSWGDPGLLYFDDFFLFEGQPAPEFDGSYLFFGKPMSKKGADVEIESITIDNTGAYAPDGTTYSSPYQKKTAALMTPWGENLQATDPILNEYPRPQLQRSDWVNLNGVWEFTRHESTTGFGTYNANEAYRRQILVPFPVESALSGIMDVDYTNMDKTYIYKRTFSVDPADAGKRIMLNFGAVDWETYVFVNGTQVAHHVGGYDPFSADITDALNSSGDQELVVQVYDPTKGGNPRGKQDPMPGGIWYTPSSGIWQTVWYEAVAPTHITDLTLVPDVDNGALKIRVDALNADGATAEVTVMDGATQVTKKSVTLGQEVSIPISAAKLWSPDSPFLYGLSVSVSKGGVEVDKATSYFGMRKISKGMLRGKPYMFLNNQPVFNYGTLDQGFWPDGLYTAPTYSALRYDLEETKELGMNMVRKHIKVEPARWYYYCDSIGLMVWQDMPSPAGLLSRRVVGDGSDDAVKQNFLRETEAIVNSLKNYPSIVMWVPFNEGWAQFAGNDDPAKGDPSHTINGVNLIRGIDNTRLINPASGWTSYEIGDILDKHNYSEPGLHNNKYNERVSVCGETGGYGFAIQNHIWSSANNPYVSVANSQEFADKFKLFNSRAYSLTTEGISGIVYTQITDVEQEVNGFLTYDRKVNKLALDDSIAGKVLKEGIKWMKTNSLNPILKTSSQGGEMWKYVTGDATFTNPGTGWNTQATFDDSSWNEGRSGFGDSETTIWKDQTIFLRKMVHFPNIDVADRANVKFSIFYDEDYELYINGVLAASATGYITNYQDITISDEAKAAINWGGDNLFAIHVIQTSGGQKIDLGVYSDKTTMPLAYEPTVTPPVWTEISTAEQFKAIKNNLSGFYKLTADIDMYNEIGYQPIGNGSTPFRGYLDGNGFTIICPEVTNAGDNNQGIFGSAVGAYFTDLKLDQPWITGNNDVGSLLGRGVGVTIERVAVVKPIIVGRDHTGGLIGGTGQGKGTKIKDCYIVDGQVSSTEWQAGGFLGVASDTRVENSYYTGTVKITAADVLTNANRDGSGIASRIEGGINSLRGVVSLADEIVSGTSNEFISYADGGTHLNEFINCFARNDMVLTPNADPNRGGLCPRATADQKRPIADFQSQALYESIGWDFTHVWKMDPATSLYPVFRAKNETSVPSVGSNKPSNLNVYSLKGELILKVKNPAAIWIYNVSGALVQRIDVETVEHVSLPLGIYVIKSVSGRDVEAVKVVNK
ncbi:putative Beta-galactosidase [uncultured Paludibacter sp.]|nr:putative Beta-galactosidase [uncultured Paludibacter sp.]